MDNKEKGKYYGIIGTLIANIAIVILLLLVGFSVPPQEEEGGVPVLLGVQNAMADNGNSGLVDVDIMPQVTESAPSQPNTAPEIPSEEELITQKDEETVVVKEVKKTEQPKKEKPKKEEPKPKEPKKETTPKKETPKKPEKTPEEIAAEAKRIAAEKAERERKEAADKAAKRVSNAFGKGADMKQGSGGTGTNAGIEGSPTGNSDKGSPNGTGGVGEFNLQGRSLGVGGLPRPTGNFQEEGKVVVEITVNPAGVVIDAKISRLSNTMNPQLRDAALKAAKKARFNEVKSVNNQVGTITYNFKLQ